MSPAELKRWIAAAKACQLEIRLLERVVRAEAPHPLARRRRRAMVRFTKVRSLDDRGES